MKMKNVDTSLEKFDKAILNSLSFLDCRNVYISIVFVLFLYNSCLFSNINSFVSGVYENNIVKVIILLLIIYVSRKSCLIGILLAISYVLSLNYKSVMENFAISGFTNKEYAPVEEVKSSEDSAMNEMNALNQNLNLGINSEMNMGMNMGMNSENESFNNQSDNESGSGCMNNYMPKFESVSNVCDSVGTFKDAYDTQGLNNLNGFEKQVGYQI